MTTATLIGARLGGLTIERELGTGGFGAVYVGKPDVGAPKAVKVLKDKGLAGALRREAETLLSLRHPRVVELLQADLLSDPPILVMELVEGGSLADRLPLQPGDAQRVLRGVLEGLAHAHAKGVAHLDLKPQNVLIGADGQPKIADFGLARAVVATGQSLEQSHASSGALKGTLAYMAPEVKEGQPGDLRADVYAFGVLLCQVLTGKLPQPGDTLEELMGLEAPAWARAAFTRTYCRYEKRFASAGEVLAALDSGVPPPATTESARMAATPSDSGPKRVRCPYCKEEIAEGAIKCRHCNERLDQAKPITARGAGMMCAVHLEKTAAGTCVGCGNFFCGDCLTPVKGKNRCRACVNELVDEQDKAVERAQEQAEREKDRAGKAGPNIVVTATGGSSSASSSASAAATAIAGGGGRGSGKPAYPPIRLADPAKAAMLSALWPGLGSIYVGRRVRGGLFVVVVLVCFCMFLAAAYEGSINTWGSLFLGALAVGWPWLVAPIVAFKAAKQINEERQAFATEHGVLTFQDPFFRWTFLAPLGTHEADVLDSTGRPQQVCTACGYAWLPRGRDFSARCPRCSAVVTVPPSAAQRLAKGAQVGGAVALLGLIGLCLVLGALGSISRAFQEEGARQRQVARAQQDLDEGKAAFARSDWASAVQRLESASQTHRTPEVVEMLIEARRHLRALRVSEGSAALAASDFEGALARFTEAQALVQDGEVAQQITVARYGLGQLALREQQWQRAHDLLRACGDHQDAVALAASAKAELDYAAAVENVRQIEALQGQSKHEQALDMVARCLAAPISVPPGRGPIEPRLRELASALATEIWNSGTDQARQAVARKDFTAAYAALDHAVETIQQRVGLADEARALCQDMRRQVASAHVESLLASADEARPTDLSRAEALVGEAGVVGRDLPAETTARVRAVAEGIAAAKAEQARVAAQADFTRLMTEARGAIDAGEFVTARERLEGAGRAAEAGRLGDAAARELQEARSVLAVESDPAAAERAARQQLAGRTLDLRSEPESGVDPLTKTIRFDARGNPTYYDGGLTNTAPPAWRITEIRYTGRQLRISVAARQPLFEGRYPIETLDGVLNREGAFVGRVAQDRGQEINDGSNHIPRHSTTSYSGRLSR